MIFSSAAPKLQMQEKEIQGFNFTIYSFKFREEKTVFDCQFIDPTGSNKTIGLFESVEKAITGALGYLKLSEYTPTDMRNPDSPVSKFIQIMERKVEG